ncbi:MAG: 50S ribosomal protein L11 methyltransferase [Phototrophicales bacterium]|nr:MAG: 50S ribosomal protein L11 methyltransferase [Phototrophicales bacterium]
MSRWLEVGLSVDGEAAEAVAELLSRYGYQGVAVEHEGIPPDKLDDDDIPPASHFTVRAYLPFDSQLDDTKAQLEQALSYMNLMYPMPQPVYRAVDEADWAEAWKTHYHPVRIGQRLIIRPLWIARTLAPGEVEIALDPGMAFGTGTHPTTQLCLEALEARTLEGANVLDLGCGSGILAIGAAKLGAAHVLAVDNDPVAVKVAHENVAQNGVHDRIAVHEGSLAEVIATGEQFDVLVCNILARSIIAMCAEGLGSTVRPSGHAIFSGIMVSQADDVEAALRTTGLTPTSRRQQGDWVAIEARRSP